MFYVLWTASSQVARTELSFLLAAALTESITGWKDV